jgi:diketogulonate reductase-like aldo/keto reductase
MKEIGDARGVSVAQIALSWLLHQKHVTSVIIGAKTEAQLGDNLAATSVELSSDDLKKLDDVSKLRPEYPGWIERQGGERTTGRIPKPPPQEAPRARRRCALGD